MSDVIHSLVEGRPELKRKPLLCLRKFDWESADTPDNPCAKGGANGVNDASLRLASKNALRRRCGLPMCTPLRLTHRILKSRYSNSITTAFQTYVKKRKLSTCSRKSIGTPSSRARRTTSHTKVDSDPSFPSFRPALHTSTQGKPCHNYVDLSPQIFLGE